MLENKMRGSAHSSAERDILEPTDFDEEDQAQKTSQLYTLASLGGFGSVTHDGFSPFGKPNIQLSDREKADAQQAYGQSNEASYGPSKEDIEHSPIFPDVIDRGILSMNKATELYNRYIVELLPL